ncbi:hypothetical protein QZH56_11815 [Streptomyces olivoreticuli]|uniref:hypothetical protein n=1 Tax=Streptomyces olivoreticuli TaxID=68246 RepID=UPI002657DCE0|nr:hypothetical protein [Streptomyces olivoreticuli]WKK21016.1 hypothetical protein QZH56_19225 [Streptomyces olivoreticuli]WKK26211.1 hypothetical protein QZH56_11815 [Streptomyces olivoreticuli]
MPFFNTDEPTVSVRMTGYMSYGPSNDGIASHVLRNGETYDVPKGEAEWLVSTDLAELA